MPIKTELNRIKRLKLEGMSEQRLRNEMSKVIRAMEKGVEEESEQNTRLRQATNALSLERKKVETLTAERDDSKLRLAEAEAKIEAIERDGARIEDPQILSKLNSLEFEKAEIAAKLAASEAINKRLRAQLDTERGDNTIITAETLLNKFADDISEASAKMKGDFTIDDVEVDMHAALGSENDKLVLGLDAKRTLSAETATRLKFKLRRNAELTRIE